MSPAATSGGQGSSAKLTCLSSCVNKPCYLVSLNGVQLMLDCALDFSTALNFLPLGLVQSDKMASLPVWTGGTTWANVPAAPDTADQIAQLQAQNELKESTIQGRVYVDSAPEFLAPDVVSGGVVDMANVDAILISNYTTMLALPYITERTKFRGHIFMTEPCLHFGRLFMEETIEHVVRSITPARERKAWKNLAQYLPPPLNTAQLQHSWKTIYSKGEMEASLAKVTLVGFSEKKDVFGLLTVSPVSSGYSIGSSNWIINSGYETIAYVSGSSTLTTHPRPLDQASLKNVDCLIMTSLTQSPTMNPDTMLAEFCKTVMETTRGGGNVLVPCYPAGVVYDLLECLAGQMDLNGLSGVPMFFVSPVADSSLAYSNIMAEWLTTGKQNRVYIPEEPFPHGMLAKSGRLKSFRNLSDEAFSSDYRQPCVMFCGHPSLRFGDVTHFVELWGSNPNNVIVFTEPSINHIEALAPFQPLAMKAVYCPIDTSLNFNQAKKLIRDLKPSCIAVPEQYTLPPAFAPTRTDLVIDEDSLKGGGGGDGASGGPTVMTFGRFETIQLPVKKTLERILVSPELAAKIRPVEVRPGICAATIAGNLKVMNNKYKLEAPDLSEVDTSDEKSRKRKRGTDRPCNLHGKYDLRQLTHKLTSSIGIEARLEQISGGDYLIHLEEANTQIEIDQKSGETHVMTVDDNRKKTPDSVRCKIKDILISCLEKY